MKASFIHLALIAIVNGGTPATNPQQDGTDDNTEAALPDWLRESAAYNTIWAPEPNSPDSSTIDTESTSVFQREAEPVHAQREPEPPQTIDDSTCYDATGWEDAMGHFCSDYDYSVEADIHYEEELWGKPWCEVWGDDVERENGGLVPNTACCICGGGYESNGEAVEAITEEVSPTFKAHHNGDSEGSCYDFPGWTDIGNSSCDMYADHHHTEWCEKYGHGWLNHGHSADDACCVCGGGYHAEDVYVWPANETQKKCFDDYHWVDNLDLWNCSHYEWHDKDDPNGPCFLVGHHISFSGVPASEGCCACKGGGYSGKLIGKMFRFHMPDDADAHFTLYTNEDGIRTGSVVHFMHEVAVSNGFGLVQRDISENAASRHPGNSYEACIHDMDENHLDMCIGPFWNTSKLPFLSTKALYQDEFYLATLRNRITFGGLIYIPFKPFDPYAWLLVLGVTVAVILGLRFLNSHQGLFKFKKDSHKPCWTKLWSVCYDIVRGLTTGAFAQGDRNAGPAQKTLLIGFSIFVLILLTAYTASSAAALIIGGGVGVYNSLGDVVHAHGATLCVQNQIYEPFIKEHPLAESHTQVTNMSSIDMLNALGTGQCSAVIIEGDAYDRAVRINDLYCHDQVLHREEIILKMLVVIPTALTNSDWGVDLIGRINRMIDEGFYEEFHQYYKDKDHQVGTCDYEDLSFRGQDAQLHAQAMLGPVFWCLLCIIIGLSIHFYSIDNERKAVNDKDLFKASQLSQMPPSCLYHELENTYVDEEDLKESFQELPDTTKLAALACTTNYPNHVRSIGILHSLGAFELYKILKEHCKSSLADDVLDHDDPCADLIAEVMKHPKAKAAAFARAKKLALDHTTKYDEKVGENQHDTTDGSIDDNNTLSEEDERTLRTNAVHYDPAYELSSIRENTSARGNFGTEYDEGTVRDNPFVQIAVLSRMGKSRRDLSYASRRQSAVGGRRQSAVMPTSQGSPFIG